MNINLGEEQLTALNHVLALCDAHVGRIQHDLSDPLEAAFLNDVATRNGMTSERYPALFAMIQYQPEQPRLTRTPGVPAELVGDKGGALDPVPAAFTSNQILDYVGARARGAFQGNAAGHGTFTRTNPVVSINLYITVVNINGPTTTVLAGGRNLVFQEQTLTVETDDTTALPLPSTGVTSGVLTWMVQYADGTQERNSQKINWENDIVGDPIVTDPAQNTNRHTGDMTAIVIGLSRGFNSPANKTDVDYWFWQQQFSNINSLVPVSGSMKFNSPIAPLNNNNPILSFYLSKKEGGMSDLIVTTAVRSCFKIDPNDNTNLKFSLLANPNDAGNAVNFGVSSWAADTRTYFTCQFVVTLQNGNQAWGTIMSSETPDTDPTDGVAHIKPIVFVWHCMVAGTMITMADGVSTKAVETLNSGDSVWSGNNTVRNVLATLAQPHWGPVYVVTLSDGSSLTCSGTHPILTSTGNAQAASALTVGQLVATPVGPVDVLSVTTQQQAGEGLYNLWLDPGPAGSTFMLANGIVVGDYQMQVALLNQTRTDPELVRASLPAHLHRDFDSYLEDLAAYQ